MSRSRGKEGVEGAEGLGQIKGETGRWGDRWEMGRRTDGEGDGQTARWGDVGRVEGDEIGKEKEIDIEEDTMERIGARANGICQVDHDAEAVDETEGRVEKSTLCATRASAEPIPKTVGERTEGERGIDRDRCPRESIEDGVHTQIIRPRSNRWHLFTSLRVV
jgi:hypothetical protein